MFAYAILLFAQAEKVVEKAAEKDLTFMDQLSKLPGGLVNVTIYAVAGIVLAVMGFKLFDKLTPGKMDEEILHKQNIAAAILAGAFILGICIIIAAAVHG